MNKTALSILSVITLSACSYVDIKPGAEHIILSNDETSCKRLGTTTVSVIHEFMWVGRNEKTIAEELQILAQNSAAKMGGNAIWAESTIIDGEQTFTIFKCATN